MVKANGETPAPELGCVPGGPRCAKAGGVLALGPVPVPREGLEGPTQPGPRGARRLLACWSQLSIYLQKEDLIFFKAIRILPDRGQPQIWLSELTNGRGDGQVPQTGHLLCSLHPVG